MINNEKTIKTNNFRLDLEWENYTTGPKVDIGYLNPVSNSNSKCAFFHFQCSSSHFDKHSSFTDTDFVVVLLLLISI